MNRFGVRNFVACRLALLTFVGLVGFFQLAWADDTHRLAFSKKLALDVEALGGAKWCNPTLNLELLLNTGSPLIGNVPSQLGLMNRLGAVIQSQCPSATLANVTVQTDGVQSGSFASAASTGWQFASPPATPAAALAPASPAPLTATTSPVPPSATAPQPPAPPTATPISSAFQIPLYVNYASALLNSIKLNPSLASDPAVITWWTGRYLEAAYDANQNQEFKLQPILQQGKASLDEALLATTDPSFIYLAFQVKLGQYDFSANYFPFRIDDISENMTTESATGSAPAPAISSYNITADFDSIAGMPMPEAAAAAYETAHTASYGEIDRSVLLVIRLKVDQKSISIPTGEQYQNESATVDAVNFYAAAKPFDNIDITTSSVPVATIGPEVFAAQRKAKADAAAAQAAIAQQQAAALAAQQQAAAQAEVAQQQQAAAEAEQAQAKIDLAARQAQQEAEKQQLAAQRTSDIQQVSSFSPAEKLENWINPGAIDEATLDNLYDARSHSVLAGNAVPVSMLVQADGSGRSGVTASWPAQLILTAGAGVPAFVESRWYLVLGTLSAATDQADLSSTLTATKVYQCAKPQCTEALDPRALVDHKDAALTKN